MSAIKRKIEDDYMEYGISPEVLETMRLWHEIDKRLAVQEEWHRNFSKSVDRELQQVKQLQNDLKKLELSNESI